MFIIIVFWLGSERSSRLLFFSCPLYLFPTDSSLLTFFVCFFILFHSCCSHARVFGKTLVHELPISYSHAFWKMHSFFRETTWSKWSKCRLSKTNYNNNNLQSSSRRNGNSAIINLIKTFVKKYFHQWQTILIPPHIKNA